MTLRPRAIHRKRMCGAFWPANGDQLEGHVVEVFQTAGVEVNKRSFHAIHRLRNKKAKPVNRQDALSILRGKKKLRNLDEGSEE